MKHSSAVLLQVLLSMLLSSWANAGSPFVALPGPADGSPRLGDRLCPDENLMVHHDSSFENGFAWEGAGVGETYDGAFAEAFDVGPGEVSCVSFWHSQVGDYEGQTTDVYVWEGGIDGDPGNVLAMVAGIVYPEIPLWPDLIRLDVEIPVAVAGPVTVGSWGNWPSRYCGYFWLVDVDGPMGHPWTHIASGLGWPDGWQNPDIVFGPDYIRSMGIGVHFVPDPVPAIPATWGRVKQLYSH